MWHLLKNSQFKNPTQLTISLFPPSRGQEHSGNQNFAEFPRPRGTPRRFDAWEISTRHDLGNVSVTNTLGVIMQLRDTSVLPPHRDVFFILLFFPRRAINFSQKRPFYSSLRHGTFPASLFPSHPLQEKQENNTKNVPRAPPPEVTKSRLSEARSIRFTRPPKKPRFPQLIE